MPIRIGINAFLFASRFTNEQIPLLATLRDMGFEGVEIPVLEPGDFDSGQVRRQLQALGWPCCGLSSICGPGRDLRGTVEEQQAALGFIRSCIDAASDLECGLVGGPLYSRVGRTDAIGPAERTEQLKLVAGHLRGLGEYAQKRGVRLALEPLIRFESDLINTCREALELIGTVGSPPWLGLHLDTFHMNTEEANPSLAVVEAGARLFGLHVADNHRGAPGTGAYDWQGFRDALRLIGYDGYVTLETFHPDVPEISYAAAVRRWKEPTNVGLARKGLDFLKALFQE